MYELKAFDKNGVYINAVYVVQKGDTLLGIQRKVKKAGGEAKDLYRIHEGIHKGLAPGQLVYFNSKSPRLPSQKELVLNYYEILRIPHEVVELSANQDYRAELDGLMGVKDGWRIVFLNNRMSIAEFQKVGIYKFRIYKPLQETLLLTNEDDRNIDSFLVSNQTFSEFIEAPPKRTPSSESSRQSNDLYLPIGAVVFLGLLIGFVLKRKKRFDLF